MNVFMVTSELRGQCEVCTTITPEFEHAFICVSICGQIQDSVRPARTVCRPARIIFLNIVDDLVSQFGSTIKLS